MIRSSESEKKRFGVRKATIEDSDAICELNIQHLRESGLEAASRDRMLQGI